MSTILHDLSPVPLPDEKPSNRGKFSDERRYWEEIHKRRYLQWQGGDSVEDIAVAEGVTVNAIRHSLMWCEGRLPRAEVLAAHQTRLRLQAFTRLSGRYLDELTSLMSDPSPVVRIRALEAFRRTVGLEGGGVHVNVNSVNQAAFIQDGKVKNFERRSVTRLYISTGVRQSAYPERGHAPTVQSRCICR